LHPRFGSAVGETQPAAQPSLGKTFDLGEGESLPVLVREFVDEVPQDRGQRPLGVVVRVVVCYGCIRNAAGCRSLLAVVVDDLVVSDPVQPGRQPGLILNGGEAEVNLDEHVLENVFGIRRRPGPGLDVVNNGCRNPTQTCSVVAVIAAS
jgi:hypothetical protein